MSLLSRLAVRAARAYGMLAGGLSTNVSADYLVVAGGGGGGGIITNGSGGGGGAGGYLTSSFTLSTLNTYSITVGAGGTASVSGSNSVISGTGLTTVTSTGGGAGAEVSGNSAAIGGSGGGGGGQTGGTSAGAAGTSGQGNAGGNGGLVSTNRGGGGGGGASAVGANQNGGTGQAGAGGAGSASSISGSSVTYAGGGGGGGNSGGAGGAGGGANGASAGTSPALSGTANTGGGGGGGDQTSATRYGGAGGSGIVIISYTSATPKFVGGTITTSGGKQIHTFTSSGTLTPVTQVSASYLVVAGGGGGGSNNGGGAGAGGYQTSTTTLYYPATYLVTVGAGGSGAGSGSAASGSQGSNSVLSGTGITTITSTGGGYGAGGSSNTVVAGGNGGSGGGGRTNNSSGGTGTSGQGNNGGTGGPFSGSYAAGGGGGAGAAGANASSSVAGDGGVGLASSISGTSTYYAGGGGGGLQTSGTIGAGGNGGGGAGSITTNAVSGTTNTGGGGGGGGYDGTIRAGGSGGSGVVIISYAGSQVFNGGTITSSGGNTIHTFYATGALTPITNNLTNSLRFRSSASAYLNRTFTTPTNNKIWTWSGWIKRGALSGNYALFSSASSGTGYTTIRFTQNANDDLAIFQFNGSTYDYHFATSQLFRDPSAWYHIVVAMDTTQATAANRMKLYVNGNQVTAFSSSPVAVTYPTQNLNTNINSAVVHRVGANNYTGSAEQYFDGYMTDINFIDGQALEPYYFGSNDSNNVWKPIKYYGTYGTNGFYLTFGNTTSTTTLGYDSSPNGNNWTTNNISLTAGTTYDAMTDVPTLTSATAANYPTLNPINKASTSTISNANLGANSNGSTWNGVVATMEIPSTGKWYWEVTASGANSQPGIVSNTSTNFSTALATYPANGFYSYTYYASNGYKVAGPSNTQTAYGATYTNGDVIGIALDMDAGTLTFYKNNTSQGTAFTGLTDKYLPYLGVYDSGVQAINFGQRPFSYTPPTGYVALNTYNLPTPTIIQGNRYMDATLWTGTGTTLNVVNASQFKPDFVWVKSRSNTFNNNLFNSTSGVNKFLVSDTTAAEASVSGTLTAFNSNGFSVGSDIGLNFLSGTYVGWQWQAGQGSTSSNTSGSITSTVSVNATAGFSIVTYSSTSTNATIGHGLGVAPKMIIVKGRNNVQDWYVYHTSLGAGKYILLNGTGASVTDAGLWQNTTPTSSVFSIGAGFGTVNYLAYCWAEIAGFSRFGSYTGNGSADGPFVYTGFRPRWIMQKNITTAARNWEIIDTSRDTYNVEYKRLFANLSNSEDTSVNPIVDYLANGFKMRTSDSAINGNGDTYIYAAFAENPFKYDNAR